MAGTHTLEFNDSNFDQQVLQSDKPVLVDFWAEWCAPCKALGPVIDELARDYDGRVKVGKVDIEANQKVFLKFGVQSIPTVVLFHRGQVVEKLVGLRGKKDFQLAMEKVLSSDK